MRHQPAAHQRFEHGRVAARTQSAAVHDFAAHAAFLHKFNEFIQHLLRFFLRVAVQIHIGHHFVITALQAFDVVRALAVFAECGGNFQLQAAFADEKQVVLLGIRLFRARFDGRFVARRNVLIVRFDGLHAFHGFGKAGFRAFFGGFSGFGFGGGFFAQFSLRFGFFVQRFELVLEIHGVPLIDVVVVAQLFVFR